MLLAIIAIALVLTLRLQLSVRQPVGAILVLGGSIQREIHATRLAAQLPQVPILISQGSMPPCIRLIFERSQQSLENVWLEECARSTFGNFYYNLPILQKWRVRKVKLVTSGSHVPRSLLMARIILGSHGIWVESDPAPETGRPGNRESGLKTVAEVGRSLAWAVVSQFYQPKCSAISALNTVDIADWRDRGFKCERQGGVQ